METVLAEKLETILSRVEINGRTRDYYDIFLIYKLYFKKIDKKNLKNAIINTFKKRKFNYNVLSALKTIKESNTLKMRWKSYQKRYIYARDINFMDIIYVLEKILDYAEVLNLELV